MIRSMTAFGRAQFSLEWGDFVLEVYSVNKKNLDISFILPKDFILLEAPLRKWVQEIALRGSVSVRLTRQMKKRGASGVDEAQFAQVKEGLDGVAKKLGIKGVESIEFLAHYVATHGQKSVGVDHDLLLKSVKEAFDTASKEWLAMKQVEGEHLAADLNERLAVVRKLVDEIGSMSENAPNLYREKLKKRLTEVMGDLDEERVVKEVVIFSEKVDTTEEIVRLKSHLKQFEKTLQMDGAIGRKFDFLIQEMNREVNSLGVKCLDLDIVKRVLEIKSEIEKMREQVQNIE